MRSVPVETNMVEVRREINIAMSTNGQDITQSQQDEKQLYALLLST